MKKQLILFFLVFLTFTAASLCAEKLVLLCNNFSPDTIDAGLDQLIDSLLQTHKNIFEISPFPFEDQDDKQIYFFNPSIFSDDSLSYKPGILATNIQSSDSSFFECIAYKPAMLDTFSVVFISIATPDFPILYKKHSKELDVQIDIFERVIELCAVFGKFGIDHIIAVNYLGDFLSNELLQKVPQIDLVIDYFSLDNNHHYVKEISHSHLINWSRKKEQLLLIECELSDGMLSVKDVSSFD